MSTLTRRTIVKGAAWSVPAVVATSTAPALAASPVPSCEPDVQATYVGTVLNADGQTSFDYVTNPTQPDVSPGMVNIAVSADAADANGNAVEGSTSTIDGQNIVLTFAQGSTSQVINLAGSSTSAGTYITGITLTLIGITADQIDTTQSGVVIVSSTADSVTVQAPGGAIYLTGVDTVTVAPATVETGSAVNGQDVSACGGLQWARERKIRQ